MNPDIYDDKPWFALRVKPRHEKVVHQHTLGKGYTSFLPTYSSRHGSGRRFQHVDLPLFPGYVFAKFDPLKRLPLLMIPGVFQVVSFGNEPAPLENNDIENLQKVAKAGFDTMPCPFLNIGDRVRIEEGALRNVEGILVNIKGIDRIVISIQLLQRSVAVEIDRTWVQRISK
jgi:transcription antitermination factor NusG